MGQPSLGWHERSTTAACSTTPAGQAFGTASEIMLQWSQM